MSPYEFLEGEPPDISHFRIWGCQAFARIPRDYIRKDLSEKTYNGYLVGYSDSGEIGYKIWVPSLKEIVISIHCNFNEVIPDYTEEYFSELTKYNFEVEKQAMDPREFDHLVGAKYIDDDDWMEYVNTKVGVVGGNIVVWRAPIVDTNGQVGIEESAPIFVADVVRMMGAARTPPTRQELDRAHTKLEKLRNDVFVQSRNELNEKNERIERKRVRKESSSGQFTRRAPAEDLRSEVSPRVLKRLEKKLKSKAYMKTSGENKLAGRRGWPESGGGTTEEVSENESDYEEKEIAHNDFPSTDEEGRTYDLKQDASDSMKPGDNMLKERRKRVATKLLNVGTLGDIRDRTAVASLLKELDEEVEPQSFEEAAASKLWRQSMREENGNMERRGCWKIVRIPSGKRLIKCKYVYKIKRDFSGRIKKRKSRLVIQGFRQQESDYNETFAPVVKGNTFRLLVALARTLGLDIQHMDVDAAFLYADLDEDIYMEPPPNLFVPDGCCLKLLKSLYGLKQAPPKLVQEYQSLHRVKGVQAIRIR